jgi:hypothetical protein
MGMILAILASTRLTFWNFGLSRGIILSAERGPVIPQAIHSPSYLHQPLQDIPHLNQL